MCCEKLGGMWEYNRMKSKYDIKIVIPLLMVCIGKLVEPNVKTFVMIVIDVMELNLEENMFTMGASNEESL